ncbi:hypothetical protein HMPREF3213_00339 [Heyndrickxia coagulans]|uniref:Uncharacterized protein n=1 Tax=Heyndrickxia coagulans TaxID=1398 RepID=A0A0C5CJ20_HEYCO|nr:hypothetical protein SB48_HM08orf00911 [Heyndrickxia coagulans]KWZ85679.1 hypothetical protein HMPREF3213_00339 [Heyndrickxia coagulans]
MISRFTNEKDFQQVFVKKEVLATPAICQTSFGALQVTGTVTVNAFLFWVRFPHFSSYALYSSKAIEFKTKDLVPFT